MLIGHVGLRVAVSAEIEVVTELALVASANNRLGTPITLIEGLTAFWMSIEHLEPAFLLVAKITRGPILIDWRVLLVTLVIRVAGNLRGRSISWQGCLWKKSIRTVEHFGMWLL